MIGKMNWEREKGKQNTVDTDQYRIARDDRNDSWYYLLKYLQIVLDI